MRKTATLAIGLVLAMVVPLMTGLLAPLAGASSHREAPLIKDDPAADNTDFYMFRSYDDPNSVTFIANYIPLQSPYGGPNFHHPSDDVLYSIKIDNDGDAIEDIVYQFRFQTTRIPSPNFGGPAGDTYLYNDGTISSPTDPNLLVRTTYSLTRIDVKKKRGPFFDDYNGSVASVIASNRPIAPAFVGKQSYCHKDPVGATPCSEAEAKANYEAVAAQAIFPTSEGGKVFVGPRQEGFYVDLGKIFDLARLGSVGYGAPANQTAEFNVTTLAIQVPINKLRNPDNNDPVIGAWATAARRQTTIRRHNGVVQNSGPWVQVSRLGSPLVNEAVIGAKDKDRFNATEPRTDVANFAGYVLNPRLATILNALYPGAITAKTTARNDLVQVFVTGIPLYTRSQTFSAGGEMLRLNTAVPPTPKASRNDLGVIGGDLAGFPNGRRPTDDVVDVELTAVTLASCSGIEPVPALQPLGPGLVDAGGNLACTLSPVGILGDGVSQSSPTPLTFLEVFPYLPTPLSGTAD
jgi:hypothetical protein